MKSTRNDSSIHQTPRSRLRVCQPLIYTIPLFSPFFSHLFFLFLVLVWPPSYEQENTTKNTIPSLLSTIYDDAWHSPLSAVTR